MSFTFNITVTSDIDKVRFNTGDTDSTDYYLEDESITYLLTLGNVAYASVEACYKIKANLARKVDETVDDHSKSYSQLQQHFTQLAIQLEKRLSSNITFADTTTNNLVFTQEKP